MHKHTPTEITPQRKSRQMEIAFARGMRFERSDGLLRVFPPPACAASPAQPLRLLQKAAATKRSRR